MDGQNSSIYEREADGGGGGKPGVDNDTRAQIHKHCHKIYPKIYHKIILW